jgi:hypothetical protein
MYRVVPPSGVRASMKVRAQLFGQKWQHVLSSFRGTYARSIAASSPTNVEYPRRDTTRSVSSAAPIAQPRPGADAHADHEVIAGQVISGSTRHVHSSRTTF